MEKLQNLMQKELDYNAFILLEGIFNKLGGPKYAGGIRLSCYQVIQLC